MIFISMIQQDLFVIIFIPATLVWMKLKWIEPIYYKIGTNLVKNLNQEQKKDRDKKSFFESVNALYECRELILNAFRSDIFPIKKQRRTIKNINFTAYQ